MKEFNLDAALNGEQVKLRNGLKAIVYHRIPDEFSYPGGSTEIYPLLGIIFNKDGTIKGASENWKDCGAYCSCQGGLDIVGMWEEHKLTSEQVLEKAYKENFLVLCDGNPDLPLKVIAKTKNGEFVMQPEDGIIQPWLANLTMEWFFVKKLDPKFDTSTLPKPFKPHIGDEFFYLSDGVIRYFSFYADCAANLMINGQCFRTKEDAQKWLDFMKSMME